LTRNAKETKTNHPALCLQKACVSVLGILNCGKQAAEANFATFVSKAAARVPAEQNRLCIGAMILKQALKHTQPIAFKLECC